MKVVCVPRINGLGHSGSEEMAEKVLAELKISGKMIDVGNENIDEDERRIYFGAKEIFGEKGKVVFVGGDHSITYPIFKAFSEKNKDAFLIVFDAHADCMPTMEEPTHEEWLRAVVENCGLSGDRIILIGARKIEPVERKFLREKGVKVFSDIYDLESVWDYITERANGADVYVSVDVDVLDPVFAPAVNYPEVDGLSSRELFYLLKRIFCIKSLKCLDVVEVVPSKDEKYDYRTVKVAAKIVWEFLRLS